MLALGVSYIYTVCAEEDDQDQTTQTDDGQDEDNSQEEEDISNEPTVSVEVETESKTTVSSKQSDSTTQNSYSRQPDVGGVTGNEFGENQNSGTIILDSSNTVSVSADGQKNIFDLKGLFQKLMIVTVLLAVASIAALIYVNRPSFAGKKAKKGKNEGDDLEISSGTKRSGSVRRRKGGKHDRRRK